jgi:hypothetical protein
MGNILVKDEEGNLRADFGLMKRNAREGQKKGESKPITEEER